VSLAKASQEISQVKRDLEAEIDRLKDENETMRRQSADEKTKVEALRAQCDAFSLSEIKLREEAAEADKLRSQIETQFSESLKEKDALSRKQLEAAQSELRIALKEIKTMEAHVDQLSTNATLLERMFATLTKSCRNYQEKNRIEPKKTGGIRQR
jgi:chromosome segregation ATPase